MFSEQLLNVLSGVSIGIIIFQSAVIAPTVLKTLDFEPTSKFLRSVWPTFFKVLVGIGFVYNIVFFYQYFSDQEKSFFDVLMAPFTLSLPIVALAIIPETNRAADNGNKKKFNLLHISSVALTLILLAIYILSINF